MILNHTIIITCKISYVIIIFQYGILFLVKKYFKEINTIYIL